MPCLRQRRLLLALPIVFILMGCGDNTAEQRWLDYHQQLANDLDISAIERARPRNIGAFPERQSRLVDVPEIRESILNVYALRECQITSLIAARNNQLGRVAPPSQQWLYERTLWQRLSSCWNSEVPDALSLENRARLEQLTLQKTAQLPAVGWNAIFDSEEWVKSFSRASQPLGPGEIETISPQLVALDYLYQMVIHQFDLKWQATSATLESHLKTLQERPLTAEILRALILATQRLDEANQALSTFTSSPDRCLHPWEASWLSAFEQHAHQWLMAVNQLIDAHLLTPPEAVLDYQENWLSMRTPTAPWQQFQIAKKSHEQLRSHFPACPIS
ncbi:DUF3080 family protein [Vreelandella olivaria]|uniref:DUF3080 family protein n=1 Tax=Vreelandella olivaria TaxID=390919 RepID=UPI00201F9900|nr:DUF3080 family protein [Halomonas olivaria]